ncbi:DMT family transporter [Candidatus Roizmanbacteria bacterium]|nr:DMT family transporter [Candidatus Roizmanbacteria bacterium]
MANNNLRKGILFAFLTSIISGIAIFYSKISVAKINPLVLTTSRNLYVGILFIILFFLSKRWKELKKLKRSQWLTLIFIGLIGGWLPFYLFFTGLQFTQAITANLIHKTLFIWVTILAVIFLGEKLNFNYLISFLFIVFANFYFTKPSLALGKGEVMILTATLLWSIENIIAKKVLKSVSSELVGLFRMGIGALLLSFTAIFSGKASLLLTINNQQLTIIIIGGTILFFYVFTWYKALKFAPASLVTLILSFAVVVGNILNGSIAGVKFLPKDFYSSLLIGVAMLFILSHSGLSRIYSRLWMRFKNHRLPE